MSIYIETGDIFFENCNSGESIYYFFYVQLDCKYDMDHKYNMLTSKN